MSDHDLGFELGAASYRAMGEGNDVLAQAGMWRRMRFGPAQDGVVTHGDAVGGPLEKRTADDDLEERLALGLEPPPQMTGPEAGRIVVEGVRHVREPMHHRVHTPRHLGERSFELGPGSHLQKLVGIEREHEVGSVARQRFARERRHAPRLPVSGIRVMHHPQRQAFGLQLGKDAGGAVERTVIDDEQSVDDTQVVPHEGLDDIGLVPHHRYAEKPHDQITATVGAGDGSG